MDWRLPSLLILWTLLLLLITLKLSICLPTESRDLNFVSRIHNKRSPADSKGSNDEEDWTVDDYFYETLTIKNIKEVYGQSVLDRLAEYNETVDNDKTAHGLWSWLTGRGWTPTPDTEKVTFYLFTNPSNPDQEEQLILDDLDNLKKSTFDPTAPTKIICHGWMSNYQTGPGPALAKAYFEKNPHTKMNIIMVDWWDLAGIVKPAKKQHSLTDLLYFPPAFNTRTVGGVTAKLIQFLIQKGGAKLENFHLIGHSLGSHAMGWAGRELNLGTNPRPLVPRITALDPAKPCFEYRIPILCSSSAYQSLSQSDAEFVDVIHTHGRLLGFTKPLGHADFYPNGGETQPGCSNHILSLSPCSHLRAIELMAATVTAPLKAFVGAPCESVDKFANCSKIGRSLSESNKIISMGEECPPSARGIFYLETEAVAPFYK